MADGQTEGPGVLRIKHGHVIAPRGRRLHVDLSREIVRARGERLVVRDSAASGDH